LEGFFKEEVCGGVEEERWGDKAAAGEAVSSAALYSGGGEEDKHLRCL
jgi:hypothetical protein